MKLNKGGEAEEFLNQKEKKQKEFMMLNLIF